jgi:hypothetical protein
MKKQIIFSTIILFAAITMVSCGKKYTPRTAVLNNMNDSINYALGYDIGAQMGSFRLNSLEGKDKDVAVKAFIDALDRAFNNDEIYQIGVEIGSGLKQMEKEGLLGEADLKSDAKLIRQGLEMGLKGTSEWSPEDALMFLQMVMMQIEEERMRAHFNFDMNELFIEEEIIEIE